MPGGNAGEQDLGIKFPHLILNWHEQCCFSSPHPIDYPPGKFLNPQLAVRWDAAMMLYGHGNRQPTRSVKTSLKQRRMLA